MRSNPLHVWTTWQGCASTGAHLHTCFSPFLPATARYFYKPMGNGVKNQLVGNFRMQKVTCCLAAARQAVLDFDLFNPKLTSAARLFFLFTLQCCLNPSRGIKCLKSSLLLSGRSSPPFSWPKCTLDRICRAWFQRNLTGVFPEHHASALEMMEQKWNFPGSRSQALAGLNSSRPQVRADKAAEGEAESHWGLGNLELYFCWKLMSQSVFFFLNN